MSLARHLMWRYKGNENRNTHTHTWTMAVDGNSRHYAKAETSVSWAASYCPSTHHNLQPKDVKRHLWAWQSLFDLSVPVKGSFTVKPCVKSVWKSILLSFMIKSLKHFYGSKLMVGFLSHTVLLALKDFEYTVLFLFCQEPLCQCQLGIPVRSSL